MKTLKLSILFLFSLLLFSCQKQPVANFTTDKTLYDEGDLVVCSNTSEDATSYQWATLLSSGSEKDFSFFLLPGQSSATIEMIAYNKNMTKSDKISKTISVRLNCEKNSTGQYYFRNSTSGTIFVSIDGGTSFSILSGADSENIVLSSGTHTYNIVDYNSHNWNGNIDVIQCELNGINIIL